MSEEEKKAIDNFKKLDFFDYDWQIGDEDFETREDMLSYVEKMQKIIIDLINKQQEKIVDLETKLAIETIDNKYNQEERDEETIPRYKIREKIKEYQEKYNNYPNYTPEDFEFRQEYLHKLGALEKLLEEN